MKKCRKIYSIFLIMCSITLMIFVQNIVLGKNGFCMGSNLMPTAIVVDDETGQPIEGAVAISIWRKVSDEYWFEGTTYEQCRIEEAVSDKEGKIYIDDFWDWHFSKTKYPRLTVYKFGYVCWDQKRIFIDKRNYEFRKDFDKEHRVVRLKRFPKNFSYVDHDRFIYWMTGGGEYSYAEKKLFRTEIHKEIPFRVNERNKINGRR